MEGFRAGTIAHLEVRKNRQSTSDLFIYSIKKPKRSRPFGLTVEGDLYFVVPDFSKGSHCEMKFMLHK